MGAAPAGSSWSARCAATGLERTVREGVEQTRGYIDRCGAESGHLIVFDRAADRTWEEKVFRREAQAGDDAAPVTVWGM